ncbi:type II secretion system protein [Oleomonas cavernae]|uniref:type II secretion system protein n=1 Tax=Oleomonas cavernae TaxID=2320859 RepID=UPI001F2DECA1|nr:hypothetical protein [Oleomonas cavernae]
MGTGQRHGQAGMGLMEVLVALGIVGAGLGVLFNVVGDSALRARHGADKQAALVVARSQIAAAGIAYPLDGRVVNGLAGPLAYSIESRPYGDDAASEAGTLWLVTVSVRARAGGPALAELRSLRLAPP